MHGGLITENMMAGFSVLEKWGEKSAPAVDYMMHLISHEKWTRRMDYAQGALRVLGAIGPKAKKALPHIKQWQEMNAVNGVRELRGAPQEQKDAIVKAAKEAEKAVSK